jgi:hypothetical protein
MPGRALVIGVIAATLVAGCGSGGGKTSTSVTTPTATTPGAAKATSELAPRSLRAGELKGFGPVGPGTTETDAQGWLSLIGDATIDAAKYTKSGFVAGFKRDLQSGGVPGQSLVVKFRAAPQAAAEVIRYSRSVPGSTYFPVPGLPGAKGLTARGQTTGDNVAFSKGAYFYAVGRVRQRGLGAKESRATVIAAAKSLRARVPG